MKGFAPRRPYWLTRPLKIAEVRKQAELMELETRQFYQKAIGQVTDAGIRKLLGDLEEIERKHQVTAGAMQESIPQTVKKTEEDAQRRLFVLQIVQPGLAGLMDGSVSTLAPVFAAAFATKSSHDALLVGSGGVDWRGNLHGVCRGIVGRRIDDRPGASHAAWRGHWIDDGGRRYWAHVAVSA